ncbi:MAG: hypothetical protein NZ703_06450, partial [Gemmataceae bacterium]|nr:hypothetical protein [Gemmataceae bacterium]
MHLGPGLSRISVLNDPLGYDLLPPPLQLGQADPGWRCIDQHLQVGRRAGQIGRDLPTLQI